MVDLMNLDTQRDSEIMAGFFNSLLREWDDWGWQSNKRESITLKLNNHESLLLGVSWPSTLGRHVYSGKIQYIKENCAENISFLNAAKIVIKYLGQEHLTADDLTKGFIDRIEESSKNILVSLKDNHKSTRIDDYDFLKSEQSLFFGHSFHPAPKSKSQLSIEQQELFCPEMRGKTALVWYSLKKELVTQGKSKNNLNIMKSLGRDEGVEINADEILFPVHPFQEQYLISHHDIIQYLESGVMRRLGESKSEWFATSSMRTLYAPCKPFQLKFSMNIKLTNSMRNLSIVEVERGLQFEEILSHPSLRKFHQDYPYFSIMHEPCYLAIKDMQGNDIVESIVALRCNTHLKDGDSLHMVATLAEIDQRNGTSLAKEAVKKVQKCYGLDIQGAKKRWFHAYLDCIFQPLLNLAVNYGIHGSAHAQNTLVRLEKGLPVQGVFRDCQGTWFTESSHKKLLSDIPSLVGKKCIVLSEDKSARIWSYYVVINNLFNIVTALSYGELDDERLYLEMIQKRLEQFQFIKNHNLIQYLLNEVELSYKGNFLCTLRSLDEVSQEDPLGIYTLIKNPLRSGVGKEARLKYELNNSIVDFSDPHKIILQDFEGHCLLSLYFSVDDRSAQVMFDQSADISKNQIGFLYQAIDSLFSRYRHVDCLKIQDIHHEKLGLSCCINKEGYVQRELYYQLRSAFLVQKELHLKQAMTLSKNGLIYPERPTKPLGNLYHRYHAMSHSNIKIETFDIEKHLDLFFKWQNNERVSYFWELNREKGELKKYIEELNQDPHIIPMIMSYNGQEVGYFECYWCKEDRLGPYYDAKNYDRGFHLLIGEDDALGYKSTFAALSSMVHFLFLDDPRTESVLLEPRSDNDNLLKYIKSMDCSWIEKEFDFPHKTAKLVRFDRNYFFRDNYL